MNISQLPVPDEKDLRRIDFSPVPENFSVDMNPSLGYIRQQFEVSRIENKLERSMMLPDLSVGYFSQTIIGTQGINGVERNFGQDFRFSGIQAGISVPLWIGPFASRSKAARINENLAQADAENFSKSVNGNYLTLIEEFNKFSSSVDFYEKQAVPEAEMIIEQAALSYKAGALDYLDYVLTLDRALSIKQNFLDALNNYNQTIISIEYITGKIF